MKEWKNVTISEISEKPWHNITLYSFKIEGEDRWFRHGKKAIPAKVSDVVSFEERGNQVTFGSITVEDESTVTETHSTETASVPSQPSAESAKPTPTSDVGKRIRWQEARRDATSVVVAALHTDALPWASNVAKGKKLDLLRGYINELASQFLEDEANA